MPSSGRTRNDLVSSPFKETSSCIPEVRGKSDRPLPHSLSQLKALSHAPQHAHVNGHHSHPPAASRDAPAARDRLSDEEEEESGQEDEEEEEEVVPRKWRGIEAVFEAYQEYVDGESETPRFICFVQIEALLYESIKEEKLIILEKVLCLEQQIKHNYHFILL